MYIQRQLASELDGFHGDIEIFINEGSSTIFLQHAKMINATTCNSLIYNTLKYYCY